MTRSLMKLHLQFLEESVGHQFVLNDDTSTTSFFDLLFSRSCEVPCFHNHWLFRKETFTKNFVETSLYTVDNRSWTFRFLCIVSACLFADQGPQFIKVHRWTVVFVHRLVIMEHTDFSQVTRMVFA